MPADNIAKIVIPTAIGVWLVSLVVLVDGVPHWLQVATGVAMAGFIACIVVLLILGQSGWSELAKKFPAKPAFTGPWKTCPSAMMSGVRLTDPEHTRRRVRLNFLLRVGFDEMALYVSAPAIVSLILRPMRIPWVAIAHASFFEASGWVKPPSYPGSVLQLMYDPGYRGKFVEIEIGEPNYFLQLPAHLLAEVIPRLPITIVTNGGESGAA